MSACRMCGDTELIIDMFDETADSCKLKQWRFSIFVATGVQIRRDDIVSKMVCHTCCELVEKIYKYRINSIANDKLLKEQAGQAYVSPVTDWEELQRIGVRIFTDQTQSGRETRDRTVSTVSEVDSTNTVVPKPVWRHPSVTELTNQYPGIILPEEIKRCDINPDVTLDESEINDWNREYFIRLEQRLSLIGSLRVKRIDGEGNNHTPTTSLNDNSVLGKPPNIPISNDRAASPITELHVPIRKPILNRPCPKSKKISLPMEISTTQIQETRLIPEKPQKDSITTIINEVISRVDSPKTQINHISTTTLETGLPKKKRKSRKLKLLQSEIETTADEVIPKKKKRVYHNGNSIGPPSKLDIPAHIPANTSEHMELLASSLGLQPKTKPAEPISTAQVFACQVCCRFYDTDKQLRQHQKRHLSCRYCKLRIPSTRRLDLHEKELCPEKIKNNPPKLQLNRVDEIKAITNKFPAAFSTGGIVSISDSDEDPNSPSATLQTSEASKKSNSVIIISNHSYRPGLENSSTSTVTSKPQQLSGVSNSNQPKRSQHDATNINSIPKCSNVPALEPAAKIMQKSPPPYPYGSLESTTNTSVGRRKSCQSREDFFSDAEIREMLGASVTSDDHFPNTTFHYSPGGIYRNKAKESNQQGVSKSQAPSMPASQTPKSIGYDNRPPQWMSPPNKTVHHIKMQEPGEVSIFKLPPNYNKSGHAREPQQDNAISIKDFINNVQLADEWMQLEEPNSSEISAIDAMNDYLASEVQKQQAASNFVSGPPTNVQYLQTSVEQVNYYNVQNRQYPYGSVPNIAHYSNVDFNQSPNFPGANQTHNYTPYTNISPTYNLNVNAAQMSNAKVHNSPNTQPRSTVHQSENPLQHSNPNLNQLLSQTNHIRNATSYLNANQVGSAQFPVPNYNQSVNRGNPAPPATPQYSTLPLNPPNLNQYQMFHQNKSMVVPCSSPSTVQQYSNHDTSQQYQYGTQSSNVEYTMPSSGSNINLVTTNGTFQLPNSSSVPSSKEPNQHWLPKPPKRARVSKKQQPINARRFSTPASYSTNMPNAILNYSPSDSRSKNTPSGNPAQITSPTQQMPSQKFQLRIKQVCELR